MPEGNDQAIAPGSSPATVSAPVVTIALEDFQRFKGLEREFGEFKATQATELAKREQGRLDALAESGQHKKALDETRTSYEGKITELNGRYAQLEQTVYGKERDTVIAQALAGKQFNASKPEQQAVIASQLHAILADQFETSRSADGQFQVRHKVTGRPATEVLKEALASDMFAHFFAPSSRGGSGTDATRSSATSVNPAKSLDALRRDMEARTNQWASFGLGGPARSGKVGGG